MGNKKRMSPVHAKKEEEAGGLSAALFKHRGGVVEPKWALSLSPTQWRFMT